MSIKRFIFYVFSLYFLSFCCHSSRASQCYGCHGNSTCVPDSSLKQGYHCSCNQHGHFSTSAYGDLYNRNIVLPWKRHYCRENLALKGLATQSSTNTALPSKAENAIDVTRTSGDINSYGCSLTAKANDSWLMVDLGHQSTVRQVIVKRADCCPATVQVLVGSSKVNGGLSNARCGSLTVLPQGTYTSIFCSPSLNGQYVTISYPGVNKELGICGLEIYSHFIDVDECVASDVCVDEDHMLCLNTPGSFKCECEKGSSFDQYKKICTDDDECKLGTHNCSADAYCYNVVNGYQCFCNKGFHGDGYRCDDVNECNTKEADCGNDVKIHCINTVGSYNCSCETGFTFDPQQKQCVDFDECTNMNVLCRPDKCHNTYGSYKCGACPDGYYRQGWMCVDFDECKYGKFVCPDKETCKNTVGSYICVCKPGYHRVDKACVDIDECSTNRASCPKHSKCVNLMGSYKCECKKGFKEEISKDNTQICRSTSVAEELSTTISDSTTVLLHHGTLLLHAIMLSSSGITWLYL